MSSVSSGAAEQARRAPRVGRGSSSDSNGWGLNDSSAATTETTTQQKQQHNRNIHNNNDDNNDDNNNDDNNNDGTGAATGRATASGSNRINPAGGKQHLLAGGQAAGSAGWGQGGRSATAQQLTGKVQGVRLGGCGAPVKGPYLGQAGVDGGAG